MDIAQIDWSPLVKIYGPLGVFCALGVVFVRVLLNYIRKQHEAHIEDVRKERDYNRQLREQEVNKFIESLKLRDDKMERGFDEVVRALRETRRK